MNWYAIGGTNKENYVFMYITYISVSIPTPLAAGEYSIIAAVCRYRRDCRIQKMQSTISWCSPQILGSLTESCTRRGVVVSSSSTRFTHSAFISWSWGIHALILRYSICSQSGIVGQCHCSMIMFWHDCCLLPLLGGKSYNVWYIVVDIRGLVCWMQESSVRNRF